MADSNTQEKNFSQDKKASDIYDFSALDGAHEKGWHICPNAFCKDKTLDVYEYRIYHFIQSYAYVFYRKNQIKNFSRQYCADNTGIGKTKCGEALASLCSKGYLIRNLLGDPPGNKGDNYLPTRLWATDGSGRLKVVVLRTVGPIDAPKLSATRTGTCPPRGHKEDNYSKEIISVDPDNIYQEKLSEDVNADIGDAELGKALIDTYESHFDVLDPVKPPEYGSYDKNNMASFLGRSIRVRNMSLDTLNQLINNFATDLRDNHHGKTLKRSIWAFLGLIGKDSKYYLKYLPGVWTPPVSNKTQKQTTSSSNKSFDEKKEDVLNESDKHYRRDVTNEKLPQIDGIPSKLLSDNLKEIIEGIK